MSIDKETVLKDLDEHMSAMNKDPDARRVLIIYTGGTFGNKEIVDEDGNRSLQPMQGPEFFACLSGAHPMLSTLVDVTPPLNAALCVPPNVTERLFYTSLPTTIDSTEAMPDLWGNLAVLIATNQKLFDGFVVIQGTNTMYYTAAALSFLLSGLLRTVVVTGSQNPLLCHQTDATMNLIGAIHACLDIPHNSRATQPLATNPRQLIGVFLYFHFKLMLGSRCVKADSQNLDAFLSPNMGVVGRSKPSLLLKSGNVYDMAMVRKLLDEHVEVHNLRKKHAANDFYGDDTEYYRNFRDDETNGPLRLLPVSYNKKYDNWLMPFNPEARVRVSVVRLAPGIQYYCNEMIEDLRRSNGIVLEAYGAGSVPGGVAAALKILREEHHIPVAIITECIGSGVASDYDVAVPKDAGVNCHDMTAGCAYTRMYIYLAILNFMSPIITGEGEESHHSRAARRQRIEQIMATPYLQCFTHPLDDFALDRLVVQAR